MAEDFWAKWRKKFVNTGQKRKHTDANTSSEARKGTTAARGSRGKKAATEDDRSFVGVESTQEQLNTELVTQSLRPPTLEQEIETTKGMSLRDKKKLLTTRLRRTPTGNNNYR